MTDRNAGALSTPCALPLEMRGDRGGAFRVYARHPNKLTLEVETNGITIANHLDRGGAQALAEAIATWLRQSA